MATPAGFENKVGFIWKIADKLRGCLKPGRRARGAKSAVLTRAQNLDPASAAADALLKRAAGGLPFYKTSPLSMTTMLSDGKNIAAQPLTYIAVFSAAAAEALDAFGYQQIIVRWTRPARGTPCWVTPPTSSCIRTSSRTR